MITIRKAQPEDIAFIIDSQIKMAKETEGMELDPSTVAKGVAAVFGDTVMGDYFVACESVGSDAETQKPVACLLTLMEWSDWRNGNVIWIHSVYVLPEYRGQGVFPKMYEYLKQMVQASNFRGLRLYVDHTNQKAQRVYQKLGMTNEHYELYEWMK